MQKIKLNKQMVIFISLGLALLIEVFVFIPWSINKVRKINRGITSLEEKINLVKSEWPKRQEYLKKHNKLEKEIEKEKKRAISPGQESRLISFISQSSQDHNIRLNSITPESAFAGENRNFDYLPFKIEAEGNFSSLKKFLSFLQESDYFFELKNLNISGYGPSKINMVLWGLKEK